jgi:hypothetical protein
MNLPLRRPSGIVTFLVLIILNVSLYRNFKKFVLVDVINTIPPYHITTNHPRWNILTIIYVLHLSPITAICTVPWKRI